jgi:hypothetical protein
MELTLTIRPTVKQDLVYTALNNPGIDEVFFGGGAGGGKSWLVCESRLIKCYQFPGYKSFIGREELKRLMQSTYLTWVKVCQHHKIPQSEWKLNGQYNYIEFRNGSRIDLLDLKLLPSDPLYERLGSLEYSDGAIDEASEVNALAKDVLRSRVGRHLNKEFKLNPVILCTGNPKKNWTYYEFYKPWKEGRLERNKVFIQALYQDNPYTAEEYGKQLTQIKDMPTKQRLMFGEWEYEDDPNAMIDYDAIIDLYTNNVEGNGIKYLVADIARMGKDKTVIKLWEGLKCYKTITWRHTDIATTTKNIRDLLFSERISYSNCIIDEDGVGGGVVDNLRGVKGFVNNSTPLDNPVTHQPENFKNLKTQCAYKLAEMVNDHKIGVELNDETVRSTEIEEFEQLKRKDPDRDTRLQIVPKDEIKELIGRSPDYLDTYIMRMWFELSPKERRERAVQYRPRFLNRNARY